MKPHRQHIPLEPTAPPLSVTFRPLTKGLKKVFGLALLIIVVGLWWVMMKEAIDDGMPQMESYPGEIYGK